MSYHRHLSLVINKHWEFFKNNDVRTKKDRKEEGSLEKNREAQ